MSAVALLGACRKESKPAPPERPTGTAGASAATPPAAPKATSAARPSSATGSAQAFLGAALQGDLSGAFLFGEAGQFIAVRPTAGEATTLVRAAASWLFDPDHGLLWFLDEARLGVIDLRHASGPVTLATGIPPVGAIWVEWAASNPPQSVRPETACEERLDSIEVQLHETPALRIVDGDRSHPLTPEGLEWLKGQFHRPATPSPGGEGFGAGAPRVALPEGWSGCEDAERCGASAAFGKGPLRLVLIRDEAGADCFHRSCLLFDPTTHQFASPPVTVDEGGTASLTMRPPRWAGAKDVVPGSCGPYYFDEQATSFLVNRYLCKLDARKIDATCEELSGEGIGWLRPGVIIGEPG